MVQLIRDFIQSFCIIWKSVPIFHSQSVTIDPTYQHNLKAKNSGSPYEFRLLTSLSLLIHELISGSSALESILLSVLSALEAEMVFIRNLVGGLLAEMEDNIDHDRFKRLLHYSRRLASFKNRASLVISFLFLVKRPSRELQI